MNCVTEQLFVQGYERILKDLELIRDRRHMLKEYYKELKNVLRETTVISQTEQEEFLVRAGQCIADLDNKRFTILIAGKTNDCYSCLAPERPDGSY